MGKWTEEARKVERNTREFSGVHREEGDTLVRPLRTFSSMRAGTMPKKGLIAMEGRISAPSSEGRGAMQMPPVSVGTTGMKHRWAYRLVTCLSRPCHQGSGTDTLAGTLSE